MRSFVMSTTLLLILKFITKKKETNVCKKKKTENIKFMRIKYITHQSATDVMVAVQIF